MLSSQKVSQERNIILPHSPMWAVRLNSAIAWGSLLEKHIKPIILLREVSWFLFFFIILKEQKGTSSCMKGEELNRHHKSSSQTLLKFPCFNYLELPLKCKHRSLLFLTKANDFLHVLCKSAWGFWPAQNFSDGSVHV